MLAERSTSRHARRLVSSSYCLTYSRSCLPQTFQSTCRRSSPETYWRCCKNSIDCPKYGLRCIPLSSPSTMCRARTSSRPIRLISSGCKDLLETLVMNQFVFVGGSAGEQLVDELVRGDAFALGRKIHHQPMPEHGLGERLNVFHRDVSPALDQRPRLVAQYQQLHG